jgi:hypothetical protein
LIRQAAVNRAEQGSPPATLLDVKSFLRFSALAVIAGCAAGGVLRVTEAFASNPTGIALQFALATVTVILLLGLPGLFASRASGYGPAGLIGVALIFLESVMVGVFGNLYGAMVDPWLATQAPDLAKGFGPPPLFAYYNLAEVAVVLGTLLLAIPIVRRRMAPPWAGWVLLASVPVGVVLFFYVPSLPGDSLATGLLSAVPDVLLWLALAGLAVDTWTRPARVTID